MDNAKRNAAGESAHGKTEMSGRDAASVILLSLLLPFVYALSGQGSSLAGNAGAIVLVPLCSLVTAFAVGSAALLSAWTSGAFPGAHPPVRHRLTGRGVVWMQASVTIAALSVLPLTVILTKGGSQEASAGTTVGTVSLYLVLSSLLYPGVLAEAADAGRGTKKKTRLFLFALILDATPVLAGQSGILRMLTLTPRARVLMLILAVAVSVCSLPIAARRTRLYHVRKANGNSAF